jgi:hypothetical protein
MGEHANNFGKAMSLENVEEFESFLVDDNVSMNGGSTSGKSQTISKPKEPSIISKTKSAILPMSIIELRSLLHSMKVSLRFFPVTTVIGPFNSVRVCFEYLLTRLLMSIVFPT